MFFDDNVVYLGKLIIEVELLDFLMLKFQVGR